MFEVQPPTDLDDAIFGPSVFLIPADNLPKFEKKIATISNRSKRYGGEEITPVVIGLRVQKDRHGNEYNAYEVLLSAEAPRVAGWTFVARLDHSHDIGNVIRQVPHTVPADQIPGFQSKDPEEQERARQSLGARIRIPEHFRTARPNCEHCNIRRTRRDTFVLRCDETGDFKQVGSTCLQDFFGGMDPSKAAKMAEYLGYAVEIARGYSEYEAPTGLIDRAWISLPDFLAHAAMACRLHGWVSGADAYKNDELISTRQRAMESYMAHPDFRKEPSAEDERAAEAALEWARGLQGRSEYEHNVMVIASAEMIESRSAGIAASIVGVYLKNLAREERNKKVSGEGLKRLHEMFAAAKASKLKWPRIALAKEKDKDIIIEPTGANSSYQGALRVMRPIKGEKPVYLGMVLADGTPRFRDMDALALVREFAADPVKAAKDYGKLSGRCCMCRQPLTAEESTSRGYGPVCAKNFKIEVYPEEQTVAEEA